MYFLVKKENFKNKFWKFLDLYDEKKKLLKLGLRWFRLRVYVIDKGLNF